MRISLNRKIVIVSLFLILALLAAVMTVSAADHSGSEMTVAQVDLNGAEGISTSPISATDNLLISPWGIDATSIEI